MDNNIKGKNIKIARTNAKLTLEEIGEKVGVSKATIQRYESGEIKHIPYENIVKIARATGTSEAFIMGWDTLKEDDAAFHASILKDRELLEMVSKFRKLSDSDQQLIVTMIDSLLKKKD